VISALLSPILAAKTARDLEILACWAAKELNLTSAILSDRIQDVDCVWHAVLQNHAAIDFLLLAQGHGCTDFSGMCCFNLSDHSESIHKNMQQITVNVSLVLEALYSLQYCGILVHFRMHCEAMRISWMGPWEKPNPGALDQGQAYCRHTSP